MIFTNNMIKYVSSKQRQMLYKIVKTRLFDNAVCLEHFNRQIVFIQ